MVRLRSPGKKQAIRGSALASFFRSTTFRSRTPPAPLLSLPQDTTGNKISNEEMISFSQKIDLDQLLLYIQKEKEKSDKYIKNLTFKESKRKITEEQKNKLIEKKVVSDSPDTFWFVDYWCKKDVRGLLAMPFSRHWIMHIQACDAVLLTLILTCAGWIPGAIAAIVFNKRS